MEQWNINIYYRTRKATRIFDKHVKVSDQRPLQLDYHYNNNDANEMTLDTFQPFYNELRPQLEL